MWTQVHAAGRPPAPRLVRPTTARSLLRHPGGRDEESELSQRPASRSLNSAGMEGLLKLKRERLLIEADTAKKLLRFWLTTLPSDKFLRLHSQIPRKPFNVLCSLFAHLYRASFSLYSYSMEAHISLHLKLQGPRWCASRLSGFRRLLVSDSLLMIEPWWHHFCRFR